MALLRESDKHFLWTLFSLVAVILLWKGIWEGIGSLPIIGNVWVSLFLGLIMLTFTGLIYQSDPLGGLERGTMAALNNAHTHPQRHEFTVRYYDRLNKKEREISVKDIKRIEKNVLTIHDRGREIFIPVHRVRAIHRKGKPIWKL